MAEVLSQSQIDALLAAAQSGGLDEGPKKEESTEKKYKKYDFFSPRKFSKDRLKILNSIYENYTRVINSRLNAMFHCTTTSSPTPCARAMCWRWRRSTGRTCRRSTRF